MKSYKEIINESSLSRVHQHTKDRNIGMITANRGEASAEENAAKNTELKNSIRKAGHGYIPIKGKYTENKGTPEEKHVEEHSFLVVGKKGDDKGELKNFLTKHGEKHGQDSIFHKAHNETHGNLVGTKEGSWPGKGEHHNVGEFHPNRAAEFQSLMKGSKGRKQFTFESTTYINPITFFNRIEGEF